MLTEIDIEIIKTYENQQFKIIKLEDYYAKNPKNQLTGVLTVVSVSNSNEIYLKVTKQSGFSMITSVIQDLVDFTETSMQVITKNSTYLLLKEGGTA